MSYVWTTTGFVKLH